MQNTDLQTIIDHHYALEGDVRHFFFQPANHFFHRHLEALAGIADHLHQRGIPVCRMVRNRRGQFTTNVDGVPSVLMTAVENRPESSQPEGAALADIHLYTSGIDLRYFPESPLNGRREAMIRSMDALDNKYREITTKEEGSQLEQLFLDSFPYFSGCAENAIQYVTDVLMAFPVSEPAVVGHYRFSGRRSLYPENPAYWVVDNRSRDLAERLRLFVWTDTGDSMIDAARTFLDHYEARFPLNVPTASQIFARLLYPLSYIECCERFFFETDDHQLLYRLMTENEERIPGYEKILRFLAGRYPGIKSPEWLRRQ